MQQRPLNEEEQAQLEDLERAPLAVLDRLNWIGRGAAAAARLGDVLFVRFNRVTTQPKPLKEAGRLLFRKEARAIRPDVRGLYRVDIRVDVAPDGAHYDVDNVAKAVLDALSGSVFRDDVQVVRLYVSRWPASHTRVYVRICPVHDMILREGMT